MADPTHPDKHKPSSALLKMGQKWFFFPKESLPHIKHLRQFLNCDMLLYRVLRSTLGKWKKFWGVGVV